MLLVPARVAGAFLAVEDKRFYSHRGIDWLRIPGATLRNGTIGGTGKLIVSEATPPVKSTGVITFTTNAPSDAADDDIIVPEGMGGRGVNGLPYWVANSGNLFDLSGREERIERAVKTLSAVDLPTDAIGRYEADVLPASRAAGDPAALAGDLTGLGVAHQMEGDYTAAGAAVRRASTRVPTAMPSAMPARPCW